MNKKMEKLIGTYNQLLLSVLQLSDSNSAKDTLLIEVLTSVDEMQDLIDSKEAV